jgi:hypothetical protein
VQDKRAARLQLWAGMKIKALKPFDRFAVALE